MSLPFQNHWGAQRSSEHPNLYLRRYNCHIHVGNAKLRPSVAIYIPRATWILFPITTQTPTQCRLCLTKMLYRYNAVIKSSYISQVPTRTSTSRSSTRTCSDTLVARLSRLPGPLTIQSPFILNPLFFPPSLDVHPRFPIRQTRGQDTSRTHSSADFHALGKGVRVCLCDCVELGWRHRFDAC
jgi:hypothetical protein